MVCLMAVSGPALWQSQGLPYGCLMAAVGGSLLRGAEPLVVAMSCWSVCVRLRRRGARAVGEDGGVGGR